jgi:hypothetical protein
MALSHSRKYIAIDKAFEKACSRLIECTSPDDEGPEVDLTTKTEELSAIAPDPEDITAAAEVVTPEMRALIGDQLIKAKGGDVCSIYHLKYIAEINCAYHDYDRAAWEVEKTMRAAIIAEAIFVYVKENGKYEILVIDRKEWDWRDVYGHSDPDRPPGPMGGIDRLDSEGRLRLVKISKFDEWLATLQPPPPAHADNSSESLAEIPDAPVDVIQLSKEKPKGASRAAAWNAMLAKWDGRIPKTLKTSEILRIINPWIRQQANREVNKVSREVVNRLLGRRK